MSGLECHTVQEAIWERAASAGPAPLSPALADHLASCTACQAESRAVAELLAVTRALPDPEPPEDLWDGFDAALERRLSASPVALPWRRWGRLAASLAAVLVLGFALGLVAARLGGPSDAERAAADRREALLAALADGARLEAVLAQVDQRLAADEEKLPSGLVAGPAAPSAEEAAQLARARADRERVRALLIAMLAAELESESHGFTYLDRRIAEIAGQRFLYFVR